MEGRRTVFLTSDKLVLPGSSRNVLEIKRIGEHHVNLLP